ncbi:MAG: DUF1738 domain-containing protein [Acinetobacter sp.]|uniref:ArdC family protein n=1 Tax=Acinetobacter sp. TaxID=472 RepID=UPI000FA9CE09|nr:zincin-like metallopeptidase domain-containing protein [Acinetobacter sp.]RUP37966.1 MAG: DUF1738 domain-containing protein [Acinetobacter sp.]
MATPYDHITETIIKALEAGNVVWQKPWKSSRPANAITGKVYRGINPFLLAIAGMKYSDHRWLTFKQAVELGGSVKKGEHGTWITFSSPTVKKDTNGDVVSKYWLMKAYKVFNVEQCENLDKLQTLESLMSANTEKDANIVAEEIWAKYADAPEILWGSEAFYRPSTDQITMPKRETFSSNAHFYATLFHEGAHSTGHASRLNRKSVTESDGFAGQLYSVEELIAEFSSAFLCDEAGLEIPTRENTVAYLQSWIKALNDDKTMLVKAAAAAQKVADYMLGVTAKSDEDTDAADEKVLATA